jgi:crotonobetainyl-CoA:carnitine CoA-transferase CaiB-like acyl-CoA transferase
MLTEAFAKLDRAAALDALGKAGVPATSAHRYADLFDDEQVRANDLLAELRHSEWGAVVQTGLLAKFSATPGRVERAAPLLGEHTDEILQHYLDFDSGRIAELRRRGIIK